MKTRKLICRTIETVIHTTDIVGNTDHIREHLHPAFGGHFYFDSLVMKRIEECDDPADIGVTVLSPDPNAPWVHVETDNYRLLTQQQIVSALDIQSGMCHIRQKDCEKILGVSIFKFCDLIECYQREQVEEAYQEQLAARDYWIIDHTEGKGGKILERRYRL